MGMMSATICSIIDSIGDYYAVARACDAPPPPKHAMNRGIAMEGLASVVCGFFGVAHATTTYSGNIGFISLTGVRRLHVNHNIRSFCRRYWNDPTHNYHIRVQNQSVLYFLNLILKLYSTSYIKINFSNTVYLSVINSKTYYKILKSVYPTIKTIEMFKKGSVLKWPIMIWRWIRNARTWLYLWWYPFNKFRQLQFFNAPPKNSKRTSSFGRSVWRGDFGEVW